MESSTVKINERFVINSNFIQPVLIISEEKLSCPLCRHHAIVNLSHIYVRK